MSHTRKQSRLLETANPRTLSSSQVCVDLVRYLKTPATILTRSLGVTPEDYDLLERYRDKKNEPFRLRRYDPDSKLLYITIPTAKHVRLHSEAYDRIRDEMMRKGTTRNDFCNIHTATCGIKRGDQRQMQGDSGGAPRWRTTSPLWPTLVIEAGVSASRRQLRQDMRWWFVESQHEVKIVILIKYDATQRQIIFEKWTEHNVINPQPAGASSAAFHLEPLCDCIVAVTEQQEDPHFHCVGTPMVLEFEKLFDTHQPDPALGQGDIELGEDMFTEVATIISRTRDDQ